MLISNLEYIPLRLVRRFVLSDRLLLRFGAFVPYYRMNLNQAAPARLVDDYARHLASANCNPSNCRILEIGVGRTNSVAYEMAARFAPTAFTAFEPFVEFAPGEDKALLSRIAERHSRPAEDLRSRILRVTRLGELPTGSVDLVLSGSVLEHVGDPLALFSELHRILAPGGAMLHLVDYRDHFFKYPYHFLQFSKASWNQWLNPGDLPVWRLYDHMDQLAASGFSVRVLEQTRDRIAFAAIAHRVSSDYRRGDDRIQVATAAIWAVRIDPL